MVCQAGARWEDINQTLEAKRHSSIFSVFILYFPLTSSVLNTKFSQLDPGPGATIGGMIGTGCFWK